MHLKCIYRINELAEAFCNIIYLAKQIDGIQLDFFSEALVPWSIVILRGLLGTFIGSLLLIVILEVDDFLVLRLLLCLNLYLFLLDELLDFGLDFVSWRFSCFSLDIFVAFRVCWPVLTVLELAKLVFRTMFFDFKHLIPNDLK
jgi:hypothetical protein